MRLPLTYTTDTASTTVTRMSRPASRRYVVRVIAGKLERSSSVPKPTKADEEKAQAQAMKDAYADLTRGLEPGIRHRDYSEQDIPPSLQKAKQQAYDAVIGVRGGS